MSRIKKDGNTIKLWLSARDTYNWAHRLIISWPCSILSGKRLFAEFSDGDLVNYTVNGRPTFDVPADEFNAITSDFLGAEK